MIPWNPSETPYPPESHEIPWKSLNVPVSPKYHKVSNHVVKITITHELSDMYLHLLGLLSKEQVLLENKSDLDTCVHILYSMASVVPVCIANLIGSRVWIISY